MAGRNDHDEQTAANRDVCTTCGALVGVEYHPYAFCVLVKAGLNPLTVVLDAVKALKIAGVK